MSLGPINLGLAGLEFISPAMLHYAEPASL